MSYIRVQINQNCSSLLLFYSPQRRINFLNCRVGHFRTSFLRATIVIFTDVLSFSRVLLYRSHHGVTLRTATRAFAPLRHGQYFRQIFTPTFFGQRRQREREYRCPQSLDSNRGLTPWIAFSTAVLTERSNTLIFKVRVFHRYAANRRSAGSECHSIPTTIPSSRLGEARPVRTLLDLL